MRVHLTLPFIREKIALLQNALFFPISESLLKIPACVIQVINVDEVGEIWFAVPRPKQSIYVFDKVFPARLDFFRKGKDFYLRILGKAFIVTDPEDINSANLDEAIKQKAIQNHIVLLRVRITHANYTEKAPEKKPLRLSVLHSLRALVLALMPRPAQTYHLPSLKKIPAKGAMRTQHIFHN